MPQVIFQIPFSLTILPDDLCKIQVAVIYRCVTIEITSFSPHIIEPHCLKTSNMSRMPIEDFEQFWHLFSLFNVFITLLIGSLESLLSSNQQESF